MDTCQVCGRRLNSPQTQYLKLCYLHRNVYGKLQWLEEYNYSRFMTWVYHFFLGYPIALIIHLIASFMEITGNEPKILLNFTTYTLQTKISPDRIYKKTDEPVERAILGFVKFIFGFYILIFAVIIGWFGALDMTRRMENFYVGLFYISTDIDNSDVSSVNEPVSNFNSNQAITSNGMKIQDPIEIVKLRYAKGEISRDEYERIMHDLAGENFSLTPDMKEIECFSCGSLNHKGSQFCISCGSSFPTK